MTEGSERNFFANISVEVLCGTTITKAVIAAQALADQTGVPVSFVFNDIILKAIPGGRASTLDKGYQRERNRRVEIRSDRPEGD